MSNISKNEFEDEIKNSSENKIEDEIENKVEIEDEIKKELSDEDVYEYAPQNNTPDEPPDDDSVYSDDEYCRKIYAINSGENSRDLFFDSEPEPRDFPIGNHEDIPETASYAWSISEYDELYPERKGDGKGALIFTLTFLTVLIITISSYAGFALTNNGIYNRELAGKNLGNSGPMLNLIPQPEKTEESVPESSSKKLTIPEIAEQVGPCVVGIKVYKLIDNNYVSGQGSGVIMSSDGYIISNAHVFFSDEASQVLVDKAVVVLSDSSEYDAVIIGIDPKTDLAVIKINADNLPCAEFGDSDLLVVGDEVIAIGNPGGMQFFGTVTNGIVSGMNRTVYSGSYATTFIQTNAAINPGNSGGALVNQYGQVIGINSAKIARSEYEGIGFAIPSAEAKPVIDDLISFGYVKGRVKLGITYTVIDEAISKAENLPTGVQIKLIEPDMDISNKGIMVDDIITEADGTRIVQSSDILDIIKTKKAGETIRLKIYRATGENGPISFEADIILGEDKGFIPPA